MMYVIIQDSIIMSAAKKIRVLIAPDKFRPKLTATQVCQIISKCLPKTYTPTCIPLADGGDGSLQSIQHATTSIRNHIQVHDPLHRKINAYYLINKEQRSAYIEMAKASGLALLNDKQRNPMVTSTYGTGQMIVNAMGQGCDKIVLFLGGSATNDAGIGAAAALGYKFIDNNQNVLQPIASNLKSISKIQPPNIHNYDINKLNVKVATDVENPLIDQNGATHIYAPQKGATQQQLKTLQQGMINLNKVFSKQFRKDFAQVKGSGAAGGLGAGAVVFFNGQIVSGTQTIFDIVKLRERIKQSDIVVTGEGKVDRQTLKGKLVKGVVDLARQYGKKVVVFCGKAQVDEKQLGQNVRIIANQKQGMEDKYCIENAQKLLRIQANKYFNN